MISLHQNSKIFLVTSDVAMHGAAYGRPCVAPSGVTQNICAVLVE